MAPTRSHRAQGPLALDLPRVGRYRLYDLLTAGRLSCRLCGARLLRDNAYRHAAREYRIRKCPSPELCASVPEMACTARPLLEEHLRTVLLRRRSDRHRRHAQYEYATEGEPWQKR